MLAALSSKVNALWLQNVLNPFVDRFCDMNIGAFSDMNASNLTCRASDNQNPAFRNFGCLKQLLRRVMRGLSDFFPLRLQNLPVLSIL